MFTVRGIVLHLSASTFGDAKTIDAWHRQNGWSGIGYHKVILNGVRTGRAPYDPAIDGVLENGRAETVQGAQCAAGSMNPVSLGVACIGDPTKGVPAGATAAPATATTKPYMTAKQYATLVDLLASLCVKYRLDPRGTFVHPTTRRTIAVITQHSTHDPGKPFCASVQLEALRAAVAAAIATRAAAPPRRGGRRATRSLVTSAPRREPAGDPPHSLELPLQPEDVGTLEPATGTRRRRSSTRKTPSRPASARKTTAASGTRRGASKARTSSSKASVR